MCVLRYISLKKPLKRCDNESLITVSSTKNENRQNVHNVIDALFFFRSRVVDVNKMLYCSHYTLYCSHNFCESSEAVMLTAHNLSLFYIYD